MSDDKWNTWEVYLTKTDYSWNGDKLETTRHVGTVFAKNEGHAINTAKKKDPSLPYIYHDAVFAPKTFYQYHAYEIQEEHMKALGKAYADAPANTGDFQRLPAGGYIVKIQAVNDVPDKEYLRITFDIAEGEYKGFYANTDADHEYLHQFISSYKEKAMGMFKGFLKNVDASNNTSFEAQAEKGFDERQLVGKLVGIILGYEEYENNRGDVATRARINTRAVEIIRAGRFNVPELKKLANGSGKPIVPAATTGPGTALPEFQQITDDDIPF